MEAKEIHEKCTDGWKLPDKYQLPEEMLQRVWEHTFWHAISILKEQRRKFWAIVQGLMMPDSLGVNRDDWMHLE